MNIFNIVENLYSDKQVWTEYFIWILFKFAI